MQEDPAYHVVPYDHMVWALEELKRNGVKIAVFSNKPHESAIGVVETVFGKDLFDHIQGQTDLIPIKPDPAGVFEILEKFGVEKDECLYFGDTGTDMETGTAAGLHTVGVLWGFREEAELKVLHPERILKDPCEIPGLI